MIKLKKFIAALLSTLILATAAGAFPPPPPRHGQVGPPPPPPAPYHHHRHHYCDDAGLFGGLAVGLLIGAIASSNQDMAAAKDADEKRVYERECAEVSEAARQLVNAQCSNFMQIVNNLGPDHALEDIDNYWQSQGHPTLQDVNVPKRTITVSGFQQHMSLKYDIDRANSIVTVTATAPAYKVSESRSMPYIYAPPTPPVQKIKSTEHLIGFSVSEEARSLDGHLLVTGVQKATAASYVGLKDGAVLYAVDGNDTAKVSAAQMEAYINKRAEAGAIVKLTFSDGDARKTAEIKP